MACTEKNKGFTAYSLPFAAWELRLYLNSHPRDRGALWLYEELTKKAHGVHYASVDFSYPDQQGEACSGVLEGLDQAACSSCGNLDQLLNRSCECHDEDHCPYSWSWVEGPWPWDGCCGE